MPAVDTGSNLGHVEALLEELAALDIRLTARDGRLGYDAPPGRFTDALKARVRQHRQALLDRLAGAPATVATATPIVAPLSSSQERMWFLNRLEGRPGGTEPGSYTEHLAFDLAGPLDRTALDAALSALVARHGALRTLFRDGAAGPEQVVAPTAAVHCSTIDVSAAPANTQDNAIATVLDAAAHRAIDLAVDPHVRFTLIVVTPQRHVLSVSAHHAAWDGWSNAVFAADLAAAYNAARAGREAALRPLVRDVADVAVAQRDALARGDVTGALDRVRTSLAGYPTCLALPTDRPRDGTADTRGANLVVRIPPDVAAAVALAGRRVGATPFMTVLAAWALVLARASRSPRLLIGSPVAARESASEEAFIGYLSNTIAVPVDIGAAGTFGALVAQVRDRVLEAMATQHVPFEQVVEAVAPSRSRVTTPLVQALFGMQPRAVPAPALDGLEVTVLAHHNRAARYELILNLETAADLALQGPLTYATALFDRDTVAAWADQLQACLRDAPQQWDAPLDRSWIAAHGTTETDTGATAPSPAVARPMPAAPDGYASQTERALARIWAEFLKTAPTGRDDDFFMLGGHSLLLMRIVTRVNASGLGHIELAQALSATRLSDMAALIDGGPSDLASSPADTDRDVAVATGEDLRLVTEVFNRTAADYPRDASMADLWQHAVERFADRRAAVAANGDSITYAALDRRADAIAATAIAAGPVGPVVAMAVSRGIDAVASVLGVWKAGAAYLPIDATWPPSVIARLAADTGARLFLADAVNAPRLAQVPGATVLRVDTPASPGRAVSRPRRGASDPAYVMFTSGTTGTPKGVLVPHGGIARLAFHGDDLAITPEDVVAQIAPLAFDATTFELWSTLANGATLQFVSDEDVLDPAALGRALRRTGITVMFLTTGLFCRAADEAPAAFAGLRLLLTGGEVASPPHLRRVIDACPGLRVCNVYGPTENTCFTTLHVVGPQDLDGPVPLGRPIANTRVYVVDDALRPVSIGAWGELVCAGDGLALGYAGSAELTAAAFVRLPWGAGERVYRTGDIARWRRDGLLEFGGRRDGQVKIRGHRIELTAVEAVLRACPGVRDASVVVSGAGPDQTLQACIVADAAVRVEDHEATWRQHLADRLPRYMMPARFVAVGALPVNANGKRDRNALLALVDAADHAPAAPVQDDFPLSTGQERLWLVQHMFPGSGVYNVPVAFEIDGPLDTGALDRALRALEDRHHALRLRVFRDAEGQPRQRLAPAGALTATLVDLSSATDPAAASLQRVEDELKRPFDLDREPGARPAILMRLGPRQWRLLLVFHHAVVDGWSIGLLVRDLGAFYAREVGGGSTLPPAPTIQLEEVAVAQKAAKRDAADKALLERWVQRLTPLPERLALPAEHRRPASKSYHGVVEEFTFDAARSADLDRLARDCAVTPFVLATAIVQVLLHRMTGQVDLALGTLVAGRDRPELQETVAYLANTVVLRQGINPSEAFRALLARTRATCLQAVQDQYCPFETLVEALAPPRDLSRTPIFDVLVVWQSEEDPLPDLPGLTTRRFSFGFPFSKFDLSFHFGRRADRIICQVEYSADLFGADTIAALFDRLNSVAAAVVNDPDQRVDTLPILTEDERRLVVERFNATAVALETRRTVTRQMLDRVDKAPSDTAALWNGTAIDYREFAHRAGGLAHRLVEAGVRPGETVAICSHRSLDLLIGIHAILMAGAAYAPLGPTDPPARLSGMMEDLGRPIVLAAADCRALVEGSARRVVDLAYAERAEPIDLGSPDGLAYVLFTSGSTGRPKGVAIEHHAVLNRILWMQSAFPIGPGDVVLQKTTVTFDVSVWELFWWSWTGAAVAVPPPGIERDPLELVRLIERESVTIVHFVPSALAGLLDCLDDGRADAAKLARLRYVFASGEALEPALVERFDRLLYRPFGIQLHNLYGPTEATVDVTWHPCSPWGGGDVVPIGRPIANTRAYVLDAAGRPTPIGIPGELHIGGPQVARGYVNRPDLSRERFVPDPFSAGGRLYRTGDLARWRRDGTLEFIGRLDQQVKVRGQRIEPGEVEHALEVHAAVVRAVVVPFTRSGLTELHAYVQLRWNVEASALRAHLREHVTAAMVPARFFRVDALPHTSSGKLDRKALSGVPLEGSPHAGAERLTETEAAVRAIWKELLPAADPGPRDGFFDAGGNSLLVVRLHERLDSRWPGVFTVADLFASSTIAEQARRISRPAEHDAAPPEVARTPVAPRPPISIEPRPNVPVVTPAMPVASPALPRPTATRQVAVVGMAVTLPGSDDLSGFWRDVSAGVDRVRPLPAERTADARALLAALGAEAPPTFREAAYLDDVTSFDPRRLRMSPADAALLDPEQRLFLDTALRALEDGGRGGAALDDARVGVFVGRAGGNAWRDAVVRSVPASRVEQVFALNVPSNIATRLSFLHNWRGPAEVVDTACSSTLVAVHNACRALRNGECEWALVGGAKIVLAPPGDGQRMTIDSSTGRTRAFADGADGTGMGEGAIVFLLRPLEAALADGDPIHGVILGSAVNQDGASSGMSAPNPAAQAEVIAAAARDAGVALGSVSYIEAHGTGTSLGDPIEIEGLTRAFAGEPGAGPVAAIGSGKGNYGHLDGAAGALGLARALLCLAHDSAPPQPYFETPNSRIDFARAPVSVCRALTPLVDRGGPRRAGVSAFGLSGINAHALLEVPPRVTRPASSRGGWFAVGLSAPDSASLRQYAGAIVASLRSGTDVPVGDIARTLAEGRDVLDARLAVWVRDRGDLMARLAVFAAAPEAVDGLVLLGSGAVPQGRQPASACHPDEAAAKAAATAFVEGTRLAWPGEVPAGRVHLPPAPLARRRFMPDLLPASPLPPAPTGLLGTPAVTEKGVLYPLDVHAPGFWPAAEHRLNGQPTLVGMAFPALIAEARPGSTVHITDLRWVRALRPADIQQGTTTLAIAPGGATTVAARGALGRWLTFATAKTDASPGADDPATDLGAIDWPELAPRFTAPRDVPPFQRQHGAIDVSDRWDCLERVAECGDEFVGWLRRRAGDAMRIDPALLDVAAGLALDGPGYVPAGCAAITIAGPIASTCIAHVTRRVTADGIEADVRVADRDSGKVVVRLSGVRFARLAQDGSAADITPTRPAWVPEPLSGRDPGGPILVVGDSPLADSIAAHLRSSGRLAGHCTGAGLDQAAAARLGAPDAPAVVFAPSGGPAAGERAVTAMRSIMAALRGPAKLLGLGAGAFEVDAAGPLDPFHALTFGVVTSASLEEPMLLARYIDADNTTDPGDLLAEFAALERSPRAVAWRHGQRFVRHFEPLGAVGDDAPWPTEGCCVVTGGLGGLSLLLGDTLAAGGKVALALLSRTGVPAGDHAEAAKRREKLGALRAAGLRVETYACDVTDRAALAVVLDRVRRELGPITAIVHNAAVAEGAMLSQGDRAIDVYVSAIRVKVDGVRLLDELTADDPIQAFVLGGSLTALVGAPGHAAYTGANAFLDAFAADRRRRGRPAVAINWCGIRDMGLAARDAAQAKIGAGTVLMSAGSDDVGGLMRLALAAGATQVALMVPPAAAVLRGTPDPATVRVDSRPPEPPATAPGAAAASRQGPTERKPAGGGVLEAAIASVWAQVLGYETVAPDADFYQLGGDSIAGMQIVEQLVRELGQPMTLVDLFESGTVAALARRLRERTAERRQEGSGLKPAPARDRYPVAWQQETVLHAEETSSLGTSFNLPNGFWLPADIDLPRFRRAADELIARQEILRTRLVKGAAHGDTAAMEILPPSPAVFEYVDVEEESALVEALTAEVRPFDLWSQPPVRFTLGRVRGAARAFMLDVHHSLADAFSMDVLLVELGELYAGKAGPAPALHLKDYAWWSREGAGAEDPAEARTYWLDRFKGELPALDLPADRPRPPRHTWRAGMAEFAIGPDLVAGLRQFASQLRTTPFTVVTATWALLLSRYAQADDLVIAAPVDSRDRTGMAGMTGMLVSLLPLRLTVRTEDSIGDLVRRTHDTHSDALRHRVYGLGRLLADLARPMAPARAQLSEVMLSYMNFNVVSALAEGDLGFAPLFLPRQHSNGDLTVFVRDLPDQMGMAIEYYAEMFDGDRIARMGRHFVTLLSGLVSSDPATPVATLSTVDAAEAAWLDDVAEGPRVALPLERGVFGAFLDRAAAAPDALAVEDGQRRLSYAELKRKAAGIAGRLRAAGVVPSDRVALHVERDANAVALIAGITAAGATYVPLDPRWPGDRVAWVLEDCGARIVVAGETGRAMIPGNAALLRAKDLLEADADQVETVPVDGPLYVMYTAGSTGTPKRVVVSQRGVLRLALSGGDLAIVESDRVMQTSPLAYDASTFEIWAALLNGARVCVATRDEVSSPDALAAAVQRTGATVLWLTSGLFNRQVDTAPETFRQPRLVVTGGEMASPSHFERALRTSPATVFLNAYGPTENTTFTTTHRVSLADAEGGGPIPVGRPIAHTRVLVQDAAGAPAPIGVWGEIVTGGLGLADGNLHGADVTSAHFVTDPRRAGQWLCRTGDIGRWRADGVLECSGRVDDHVKLRGFRIDLGEIARRLNSHPSVAASAALLQRDDHGDATIVACVQPRGDALSPAALREWLGRTLPAYMVPQRVVTLAVLPLTPNGTIDRARIAQGLPLASAEAAGGEPPRSGAERLVADVFADVFSVPVENREASFIELGGHSLLAIRVVNRIEEATGVRLSMRDFFAVPTVASLAALVEGRSSGAGDAIVRVPDAPSHPVSHAQARLYLATTMAGDSGGAGAAYNMTFALPTSGPLDVAALRAALGRLAARHEPLRTGFAEESGAIVQRIVPEASPCLEQDDVSACADARAECLRLVRREAATPFDLAKPPLLRARAIRLSAEGHPDGERWVVLLVLHHIVGDGWSSRVLLRELSHCYRAATDASEAALPPLPLAYRDFAAWQNQRDWTDAAAYWRSTLAGAPERIELPADHPVPPVRSHRGDSASRTLPGELAARLAAFARERSTTSATVGLALFASLLYRLTRQGDMVIGLGVAGRDRAEIEGLIGFFVNVLPVRVQVSDDMEFGPFVDHVHAAKMAAMDHRDYPFDLLVRTVAPRRVANRQPLVNVIFEYQRFDEGGDLSGIFGDAAVDPAFGDALTAAVTTPTAKHDLLLFMIESSRSCDLVLEFDTDLLDRATADRWLAYLEQFAAMALERVAGEPAR